ncbi:hypothetical protein [Parasphingorhabdus pacifica]
MGESGVQILMLVLAGAYVGWSRLRAGADWRAGEPAPVPVGRLAPADAPAPVAVPVATTDPAGAAAGSEVAPRPAGTAPLPERGPWRQGLHRCEQSVRRARCAVDSVSSAQARAQLLPVVRRMDAELPAVLALVELGRSLADGPGTVRGELAVYRVSDQLDDAGNRFGELTEQVLAAVGQLVAEPDLDRVHRQAAELRDGFPLLRPMSALYGTEPAPAPGAVLDPVG